MKTQICVEVAPKGDSSSCISGTYAEVPVGLVGVAPKYLIEFAANVAKCALAFDSKHTFAGIQFILSTRD